MSTAARKARKRAGIPFTKPQKVPTPVERRTSTVKAVDSMFVRVLRRLGAHPSTDAVEAALKAEAER